MAKTKIQPPRIEKRSALRAIAKRALAHRLARHRRKLEQQAILAKRPRLPKWKQRLQNIAARAAQKAKAAELRTLIESLKPVIEV